MQHDDEAKLQEAYIEASAALLGIAIAPEWLPTVRTALAATQGATRFLEQMALPDELEPAPVFEA